MESLASCRLTHRDLALPEACARPFNSTGWVFEIKYDGYRCLGQNIDGCAQLISREGHDLSGAFPELMQDLAHLPEGTAIDGQLVDADTGTATFFAWDMLRLEGHDLRRFPLLGRKVALDATLAGLRHVHVAAHVPEQGECLFADTVFMELQGIVAKRVDSFYTAGRTGDWLEIRRPAGEYRSARRAPARRHTPGSSATTSEV